MQKLTFWYSQPKLFSEEVADYMISNGCLSYTTDKGLIEIPLANILSPICAEKVAK